jgi:hypothetical protein
MNAKIQNGQIPYARMGLSDTYLCALFNIKPEV